MAVSITRSTKVGVATKKTSLKAHPEDAKIWMNINDLCNFRKCIVTPGIIVLIDSKPPSMDLTSASE